MENKSKTYFNGSIWESKTTGAWEVIGKAEKDRYFTVKSLVSGNVKDVHSSHIKKGVIGDNLQPTVCGIGYIGNGELKCKVKGKHTKEYNIWHNCLSRCYSKKYRAKNPTYIGCSVEKRWHNFQLFCEDIIYLEGYDKWISDTNKKNRYDIDKDIKFKGNKTYSRNTCIFVSHRDNSVESNLTGLTYIATRITDGYSEQFTNQRDFARKHNLHGRMVCKCINGESKSTGGWKFETKK